MPITAACASQRSEREGHAHFEKSRRRLRSTVDCRHSQGKEERFAWRYSGSFMFAWPNQPAISTPFLPQWKREAQAEPRKKKAR